MTRVEVDVERCHGHARCLQSAPEVFGYDDTTNLAFVLADADVDAHAEAVRRAVKGCPENAIRLITDGADDKEPAAEATRS
jgi:ferredoxin